MLFVDSQDVVFDSAEVVEVLLRSIQRSNRSYSNCRHQSIGQAKYRFTYDYCTDRRVVGNNHNKITCSYSFIGMSIYIAMLYSVPCTRSILQAMIYNLHQNSKRIVGCTDIVSYSKALFSCSAQCSLGIQCQLSWGHIIWNFVPVGTPMFGGV